MYSDIISGVGFVPIDSETSGVWGRQALDLVNEIGRRIAAVAHRNAFNDFPSSTHLDAF